eukprot:TRINITY_DN12355_c0_g1_i1.p4 TRINITY_DN12355_c0_g1~~TRINITY_DN12355_c0_g1_i1.p4  ORF type:complete len:119 (+),score=1.18 TRINITY_DN12355_c0_g1_i1:1389-1745(+)
MVDAFHFNCFVKITIQVFQQSSRSSIIINIKPFVNISYFLHFLMECLFYNYILSAFQGFKCEKFIQKLFWNRQMYLLLNDCSMCGIKLNFTFIFFGLLYQSYCYFFKLFAFYNGMSKQ